MSTSPTTEQQVATLRAVADELHELAVRTFKAHSRPGDTIDYLAGRVSALTDAYRFEAAQLALAHRPDEP